jgi:hypothetical protein
MNGLNTSKPDRPWYVPPPPPGVTVSEGDLFAAMVGELERAGVPVASGDGSGDGSGLAVPVPADDPELFPTYATNAAHAAVDPDQDDEPDTDEYVPPPSHGAEDRAREACKRATGVEVISEQSARQ